MVMLANRLPGILKGDDRPRDNAERIVFARMCYNTKSYAATTRLYAEALASDPGLVRDRAAWEHRCIAISAAVLAAAGRGKDEPRPDDGQKVRLRAQALVWLKAELAGWVEAVVSGPAQRRAEAFNTLLIWKGDGRLASVREPDAQAKLSDAERKEWVAFWAEVDAVIKRAGASGNRSHDVHKEDEDIR
jgi:hypothetical protein